MPLRFVIDECLLSERFLALLARMIPPLDYVWVGQEGPRCGTKDPQLLEWSQQHNRLIVTQDKTTLPEHLNAYAQAGGRCPGVLIVRDTADLTEVAELLVVIANCSWEGEFLNCHVFIP